MMVLTHAGLTHKTPLLHRVCCFSRRPSSLFSRNKIPIARIPISGFRDLSCDLKSNLLSSGHEVFKDLGLSKLGFNRFGCDKLRLSALSDTGAGGNGGFGDSGGRGEGGDGDGRGNGGEKWSLLSWYLAMLAKYPVLIKALTSAILTLIGDLLCQLLIDKVSSLDLKRTSIFTLLGFVLVGPALHFWYLYLSKLVTVPGASGALLRLLFDQFLFSPIFIGVFLATLVTLEGRPSHVVPKLQQEWFSAVLANWQLWVPFQFLNFRFVPQQFQVLAANVIALAWNVILSFKAHKEVVTK